MSFVRAHLLLLSGYSVTSDFIINFSHFSHKKFPILRKIRASPPISFQCYILSVNVNKFSNKLKIISSFDQSECSSFSYFCSNRYWLLQYDRFSVPAVPLFCCSRCFSVPKMYSMSMTTSFLHFRFDKNLFLFNKAEIYYVIVNIIINGMDDHLACLNTRL